MVKCWFQKLFLKLGIFLWYKINKVRKSGVQKKDQRMRLFLLPSGHFTHCLWLHLILIQQTCILSPENLWLLFPWSTFSLLHVQTHSGWLFSSSLCNKNNAHVTPSSSQIVFFFSTYHTIYNYIRDVKQHRNKVEVKVKMNSLNQELISSSSFQ